MALEDVKNKLSSNCTTFINVECQPAELPLIQTLLCYKDIEDNCGIPIDGVLFYHKISVYTSGRTPLVGWLKPYMIPEMLGIPVHNSYLEQKPETYCTLMEHLEAIAMRNHNYRKVQPHLDLQMVRIIIFVN